MKPTKNRDAQDFLKQHDAIIPQERLPEIDLYMDQLTTFMDDKLKPCKRMESEKILTKTMINNYSKDKMLPASVNKKYSQTHMMLLVLIYQLKATLSMGDIQRLLTHIGGDGALAAMYDAFTSMQAQIITHADADLPRVLSDAESLLPEEDEKAQTLAAVLALSLEASAKKRQAEQLLDRFFAPEKAEKPEKPLRA